MTFYKLPLLSRARPDICQAAAGHLPNDGEKTRNGAAIGAGLGVLAGIAGGDTQTNAAANAAKGAMIGGLIGAGVGSRARQARRRTARANGRQRWHREQRQQPRRHIAARHSVRNKFNGCSGASQNDIYTLASSINRYPNTTVNVVGHTDSEGDAAYNFDLSQRRAQSVASVLINGGVSPTAYPLDRSRRGRTGCLQRNGTGSPENRRVEIIITPN